MGVISLANIVYLEPPLEIILKQIMNWEEKIRRWCARSERSRAEVLKRLSEWEVLASDAQQYLEHLESTDFVNQTRFLSAFTHDHFILKNWGPLKIRKGLYEKGCTSSEISSALEVLTPDIVSKKLREVISSRKITHPQELATNKPRLIRHLQSRGFPLDLIISTLVTPLQS
jgi:SOS response regulatory protein OraA/RecX